MTRKELMQWAEETVASIFHGRNKSQSFDGEIGNLTPDHTPVMLHYSEHPAYIGKVDCCVCLFFPVLPPDFRPGDKVEITITKKL